MDFAQVTANITAFFQAHLLLSIAALAVVVYFLYQTPKETFKFLVVIVMLAIAGYFILQLGSSTDTGMSAKEELSHKTKRALGD